MTHLLLHKFFPTCSSTISGMKMLYLFVVDYGLNLLYWVLLKQELIHFFLKWITFSSLFLINYLWKQLIFISLYHKWHYSHLTNFLKIFYWNVDNVIIHKTWINILYSFFEVGWISALLLCRSYIWILELFSIFDVKCKLFSNTILLRVCTCSAS